MHPAHLVSSLALLCTLATAQVIGIDDLDPTTGTSNTIPWGQTGGYTSLHVYSANTLRSLGVCGGAVLSDFEIAPSSGSSGTYNAPQARIEFGHLSVSPPVPGAWTTHIASPVVVHDLTSGPYTFPWTVNTYTQLPGFTTTNFVWDGVRDVGFLMTTSPGVTGGFNARRTSTQARHIVGIFGATNQPPSTPDFAAMEVRMTWIASTNCATRVVYGDGCYDHAYTFYESFPSLPVFDFAGGVGAEVVLEVTPIGTPGYLVQSGIPAWFTPTGTQVLNNAATPVAMADDSFSQALNLPFSFPFPGGSTSVIHAAANGYVLLGSTTSNASDFTPTGAELVSQAPRLAPLWCDLHPAANLTTNASSGVYFDVDPSGQTAYVTWLDVGDGRGGTPAAGATSVSVQCALHATGTYEFRYGSIVPGAGAGVVFAGWSPGNAFGQPARDQGSVDLSAALPLTTDGPDASPLLLASTFPGLGTSFVLTTTNVPPVVPVSFLFFGDALVPGIDLGFLGAPDCRAYTNANLASATIPVIGTTATASIAIPVDPLLIGASFTTQSAAFTLANALNLSTSNGLAWTVGN